MALVPFAIEEVAKSFKLENDQLSQDRRYKSQTPLLRAYTLYSQIAPANDVTPTQVAEAVLEVLRQQEAARARAEANRPKLTLDFFVDAVIDVEKIGYSGGKYTIDGQPTKLSEIEVLVKSAADTHNYELPKGCGIKPFSVDAVYRAFLKKVMLRKRSDIEALRERLAFDAALDHDSLMERFLRMACIDPTPLHCAVLKHALLNTKKAVYGYPTAYEMLIQFFGAQGCRKSALVSLLTSGYDFGNKHYAGPLAPFATSLDFSRITDPNFFAWGSEFFALVIDDASGDGADGYGSPQQVAAFKRVLSLQEDTSRAYFTQSIQRTKRVFSLYGSSNFRVSKLVPDETGARRLFEYAIALPRGQKHLEGLLDYPYLDLWRSVDEESPHELIPRTPLGDELEAVQRTYIPLTTCDHFFRDGEFVIPPEGIVGRVRISRADLYERYRNWCQKFGMNAKHYGNFPDELARLKVPRDGDTYVLDFRPTPPVAPVKMIDGLVGGAA
jgi:hypothetical protein